MSSKLVNGFTLGPWTVEPLRGMVSGANGETHHLEPKVMDVFVCLAEHANELVTRNQLFEVAWNGNVSFDEQLTRVVAKLRRALHDDPKDPEYIETVPKRGYRLIGQIRLLDGSRYEKNQSQSVSLKKLDQHKLAVVTVTVFMLVLAYFAYDEYVFDPASNEPASSSLQIGETNETDSWTTSIAVLPFVNMSDDPGNEYFSDGLSEEIMNLLANNPGLKVIGRSSSFAFKDKTEDLRVIGQTLGVQTLLEGSVRKAGDRVRITAQLIDVADGTHIWSETYDRTMTDIFAVQDDVAAAIIDTLQIHVGTKPTRGRPTGNWQAYTLFLEAKATMHVDRRHAEHLLLRATELDPSFAEAWELLAFVYFRQAGDILEAAAGQKLTGDAAAKALAINPNLVLARAMFEAGNMESWSFAAEIKALEQALRERPNNLELLHALRVDLFVSGYLREALDIAERMVELDPLAPTAIGSLTSALYAVGRTDEAIALLESQDRLGVNQAKWDLGEIYLVAGRDDIAFSYFEAHERHNGYSDPTWVQDWVARARDSESGQRFLDRSIEEELASIPEEHAHGWRLGSAEWYLYFGYLDRYFELLFATNPTASNWTDAEWLIIAGMIYRRQGFSAHPKYLEVAKAAGIMDVWEQRGPPDFCKKVDGKWACD